MVAMGCREGLRDTVASPCYPEGCCELRVGGALSPQTVLFLPDRLISVACVATWAHSALQSGP